MKRFSASRLQTAMNCQMQFKFKYVDKIPEEGVGAPGVYGQCVHLALEKFNAQETDAKGAVKLFAAVWNDPDKYGLRAPTIWPPRMSHAAYMKRGKESIKAYVESISWRKREVIAVEHKFLVPIGDYELTGYVDHMEVTKDKKGRRVLLIEDHKTSTRAPSKTYLQGNIQFTIYDYASRQPEFWLGNGPDFPPMEQGEWHMEMTKDLPRLNMWHGVTIGKQISAGERDEKDFERLHFALKQIDKAIENDVFMLDISGETCGFCPYTVECGLPIHDDTGSDW